MAAGRDRRGRIKRGYRLSKGGRVTRSTTRRRRRRR